MKLVVRIISVLGVACLVTCCICCLTGCSTSPKTQVVQMGDNQLTPSQIQAELARLDKTEQDIKSNKGVTGTNVAAFLLWWPGLAYTYYDAGEAQKLIEQRRSHLTALYNQQMVAQTSIASVKTKSKKSSV